MSYMCKAKRSQHSSGVSDLFQTVLPVHSKWNERKASTPPAFLKICKESKYSKLIGLTYGRQHLILFKDDLTKNRITNVFQ